jgi:hypothetical protein
VKGFYVKLTMCSGQGNSYMHATEDEAVEAMLISVDWRQNNLKEKWRSTSKTKWASTDGHTLEVLKDE